MRASKRWDSIVGMHDFRNFCKVDKTKDQTKVTYERTMFDVHVEDLGLNRGVLVLHGSAFLWHQVRCMMAILFLVGRGLEQPSVISDMLDPLHFKGRKPIYEMAEPGSLVLVDCEYPRDSFRWRRDFDKDVEGDLKKCFSAQAHEHATKQSLFLGAMETCIPDAVLAKEKDPQNYVCVIGRARQKDTLA